MILPGYALHEELLVVLTFGAALIATAWYFKRDAQDKAAGAEHVDIPTAAYRDGTPITHMYKWSRDAEHFAATQIAYADASPQPSESAPLPKDCVFKINHEIANPASPRADGLELVIESKMELTRREDYGYVLRIVPLRGTDFWPIVRAFNAHLGEPTMTISGGFVAAGDLGGGLSSFGIYCQWPVKEHR